jgi:hypothetical protein
MLGAPRTGAIDTLATTASKAMAMLHLQKAAHSGA